MAKSANNRFDRLLQMREYHQQGVHKDNQIGHKGISKHKINGRYYVVVGKKSCGGYATLEEAKAVYEKEASAAYGEFLRAA